MGLATKDHTAWARKIYVPIIPPISPQMGRPGVEWPEGGRQIIHKMHRDLERGPQRDTDGPSQPRGGGPGANQDSVHPEGDAGPQNGPDIFRIGQAVQRDEQVAREWLRRGDPSHRHEALMEAKAHQTIKPIPWGDEDLDARGKIDPPGPFGGADDADGAAFPEHAEDDTGTVPDEKTIRAGRGPQRIEGAQVFFGSRPHW